MSCLDFISSYNDLFIHIQFVAKEIILDHKYTLIKNTFKFLIIINNQEGHPPIVVFNSLEVFLLFCCNSPHTLAALPQKERKRWGGGGTEVRESWGRTCI